MLQVLCSENLCCTDACSLGICILSYSMHGCGHVAFIKSTGVPHRCSSKLPKGLVTLDSTASSRNIGLMIHYCPPDIGFGV